MDEKMKELLKEVPSMKEAMRLCIRQSGLTEKQIAMELDIDLGQWSRIMSGQAHFPHEKYLDFFRICGNAIPAQWLCMKYETQQVSELRAENEELKNKVAVLTELIEIKKLDK